MISPLRAQCDKNIYRNCSAIGIPDLVVRHANQILNLSGIGGINNLQAYDFTGGNNRQILLFDRDGNRLNFLRWENGAFQFYKEKIPGHEYNSVPEWLESPPPIYNWVVVAPGLCGEYKYIFTASCDNRVRLLKARPVSDGFGYDGLEILSDSLKYWNGTEEKNLIVNSMDIPGIADVDQDGDLDILTFAPLGGALQWFRNESGECGKFELVLADPCWGDFFETGITKAVLLDTCPPGFVSGIGGGLHTGSTVLPYDFDGNGLIDVALGDLNFNNINLLYNGGTPQNARITAQDTAFPSANVPIDIPQFPAVFLLDADNDGDQDLLAAPNSVNNGIDIDNLWFYENIDTSGGLKLALNARDFLQNKVLDWGRNSGVSFLDDEHLVLSIGSSKGPAGVNPGRLILYEIISHQNPVEITLIDSNYGQIDRYAFQDLCAAFGDLNNDGTPDLVLGDHEGKLYYAYLDGSVSPPSIPAIQPFSPQIDVGSNACPTLGRVDGDDRIDLLVGERNGNVNYFKNYGSKESPEFRAVPDDDFFGEIDTREPGETTGYSAPSLTDNKLLVGAKNGSVRYYSIYSTDSTIHVEGMLTDKNAIDRCLDIGNLSRPSLDPYDSGNPLGTIWIGNSRGGLEVYFRDILEGIEARKKMFNFKLYPNPTLGRLVITADRPDDLELAIFSTDGRQMMQNRYKSRQNIILDISHLPSGPYLITLKDSRGQASRLFIKSEY